ncbi:D-2-hydroxyacid dehydrogenase [Mahella sp.]|uniref:D-2-hydroxyacid dehydrogenase n=1 Tax=Mahella sp. TaxID=2798721 RepID=UPI0025C00171|nr:D-2-hydroxyacid dehydrogenase [Mahella sp.]MBZ4666736.1 D-isomer specific 2-hydroxyacid dehydrogenase NAD-binding protein [Mahella sp.]
MHKLIILRDIGDEYTDEIKKIIPDWEIAFAVGDNEGIPLRDAEILLGWNKHTAEQCLYDGTPLKWVQTWSAGVNDMPFEAFKKYDIILTNASGVHSVPISETLIGMMLAFARKINTYIRNQMSKKWDRSSNTDELFDKTAGILGVGAIGLEVARLAKALGMRTLGFRYSGKPADYVDEMYGPSNLEELLKKSDYVINVLPLTNDTFHIMNERRFEIMKPTAYYLNAGRGSTHDEKALIKALKEKWIAGAGLDVFEQEPLPLESPLWDMDNVIITPHTAGDNGRYVERVMNIFIPNLRAYISGSNQFINKIDLDKQY